MRNAVRSALRLAGPQPTIQSVRVKALCISLIASRMRLSQIPKSCCFQDGAPIGEAVFAVLLHHRQCSRMESKRPPGLGPVGAGHRAKTDHIKGDFHLGIMQHARSQSNRSTVVTLEAFQQLRERARNLLC